MAVATRSGRRGRRRGGNHGEQADHARRIRERHGLDERAAEREVRDAARERAGVGDQGINAAPEIAAGLRDLDGVGPGQRDVAEDPEQVVAAGDASRVAGKVELVLHAAQLSQAIRDGEGARRIRARTNDHAAACLHGEPLAQRAACRRRGPSPRVRRGLQRPPGCP